MESWKDAKNQITPGQVQGVLDALNLEVQSETETNYMVFCPFHANNMSAAMSVSKDKGLFHCFGAGCNASGNLIQLIKRVKNCTFFAAMRLAEKNKTDEIPLLQKINSIQQDHKLSVYNPDEIDMYTGNFWRYPEGKTYMNKRGVKNSTSKHFNTGYDKTNDRIIVPVYDKTGQPVGYVGRFIQYKRFLNSKGLPSSKTLFNYHNAKAMGNEQCIVVESSFDAMRVWQSTGKAVVATLGGIFSDAHLSQLCRSFNGVILGVDADEPGQKFAKRISDKCREAGLVVKQARYEVNNLFPPGAKDFGDCTDAQIKYMIDNACTYV